jgi:hypothetical protein
MGKSPGFWFFTGDWMKDPELRFCSIFARGLLVDLLCLMFESKRMGYLCKADGEPREDGEIVDAIAGSTHDEKLAGLDELEESGVLSRDSNGVLFSRRIARLADVSKERSKAGSKGGSKTQANLKQEGKQNRGVTVSDSVTDTELNKEKKEVELLKQRSFVEAWELWKRHRIEKMKPLGSVEEEQQLYQLARFDADEAAEIVRFSIGVGALNLITNGDHKKPQSSRQPKGAKNYI